jgi:hypothetical protein
MKTRSWFACGVLLGGLIVGCSSPHQFTQADYTWSRTTAHEPWPVIQTRLQLCLREYPTGSYGYSWQCYTEADGQGAFCDWMRNHGLGGPQLVHGQFRVRNLDAQTSEVAIGLRSWVDREAYRQKWLQILRGEIPCERF